MFAFMGCSTVRFRLFYIVRFTQMAALLWCVRLFFFTPLMFFPVAKKFAMFFFGKNIIKLHWLQSDTTAR